ncbi:MAG TPA: ABC transporter substrate-binding protein [Anaeromyxobacter sp.]|nr:ABC transporter substrate-binding protein [Anaeromyxobacter sp.]
MLRFMTVALAAALVAPAAIAEQTIKIGVLGPMAFVQGEDHWAGAELARDELNAAGGVSVGGKKLKIELVKVDTNEMQSVPDATNAIERALTRDKVDFVVGGFRSEAVLAMQEIAMDYKKLFLGCGAADAKLGQNVLKDPERYKYWFRVTPINSPDLGRTIFAILGEIAGKIRADLKKDTPRVAIFAEKVMWTESIVKAAQASLPKMKMEVVGLWQPSPTSTDVTAELAAIDRADADIVFTVISGPMGIVLGRQMGERKTKAIAFGINVEAQKEGFWQATAGKGNFVATVNTYAEVEMTPRMTPFVKAFKARFKRAPTYTADTYDALHMLAQAIEKAGTTQADKLVPVMEQMKFTGSSAFIEYDKAHDPVWGIGKATGIGVQWQDGEQVPFWPPTVKGMKTFRLPAPSSS